jgi:hypothetical protein
LVASRIPIVFALPDIVIVLVPLVNVDPGPEVSQLPLTVHDPPVRAIVPEVPLVIVTSTTETVDASAARIPESPIASDPPVKGRFELASAVVEPAKS